MNPKKGSDIPWWAIVLGFMMFPPIGFILLFMSLAGVQVGGRSKSKYEKDFEAQFRARATQQQQRQRQTPPAGSTGTYVGPDGKTVTFQHGAGQGVSADGTYHYAYGKTGQTTGTGTGTWQSAGATRQTGAGAQKSQQAKKNPLRRFFKEPKSGKAMTIVGALMSFVFSLGFVDEFSFALRYGLLEYAGEWFPCFGFLCAGLFLTGTGISKTRRSRRAKLYQGVIGQRNSVFIADLAATAGVSKRKVMDDLQQMLTDGTLPTGYIDRASERLILTDQGYQTPEAEVKKETSKQEAAKAQPKEDPDDALLRQIREVNDAIPDPEMSRKIDRIEEITRKILAYQKNNPAKAGELRQFLNYYLPTTLKILSAYAQMEAQGIEGTNISASKRRIEGMMDKVVEGFEKQLDQLFSTDAMDIATDVEVLERMLDKDGLGSGMTMGGM